MFEEIISLLLNEDLDGSPDPFALENEDYTIENEVLEALCNLYKQYCYDGQALERIEYAEEALRGYYDMTWTQIIAFMQTCG